MKLFLVIVLGVLASFGLTILAELVWFSSAIKGVWYVHPQFVCISVIVGLIVGVAARRQARLAAALSLAPWSVWLIVGANAGHTTMLRWATTVTLVSVYFAMGVGAAALVARSMVKVSESPSQERA
ncbi:MAG: hypothetical protein ABSB66_05340 [Candidatus Acidiferrales bacterium]|jgi:hypothetical protein